MVCTVYAQRVVHLFDLASQWVVAYIQFLTCCVGGVGE